MKLLSMLKKNLKRDFTTDNNDFFNITLKCIILGLMIFASIYLEFFAWIALAFSLLFVVTQLNGRAIYYLLFLMPLMQIFRTSVNDYYFVVYILCTVIGVLSIKLLIDFIKKRKKVNWLFSITTLLFVIYLLIPFNFLNINIIASLLLGVILLFVMYYYKDDINFKEVALIFIYGVLMSVIIGLFWNTSDRLKSLIDLFYAYGKVRFSGAYSNPNILAGEIMIALGLAYTLFINNSIKYIFFPIIAIFEITLLFTMSKSGFIIFLAATILFFIIYIIKNCKLSTLWKLLSVLIIFLSIFLIFSDRVLVYFQRFSSAITDTTTIDAKTGETIVDKNINVSDITTGRSEIWQTYFNKIFSTPKTTLFGFGLGAEFIGEYNSVSGFAPHNTYIQGLYYIGFIGLIVFLFWIASSMKLSDFKKLKWYNIIPLICVGLFLASVEFFSYRMTIYLLISFSALFYYSADKNKLNKKDISSETELKIPKKIHYIWLGGKPLPEYVKKCMLSWVKNCPDYEIIRWDENNLNINFCEYTKTAYNLKKYAFVSDVLRFDIIYNHGGIYLDVDVEIIKNLDEFLQNESFTAFENRNSVAPGLIYGGKKGDKFSEEMIKYYKSINFDSADINKMKTICVLVTENLVNKGLIKNNDTQTVDGITIYSSEYFCPINTVTNQINITENTHAIHLYKASWYSKKQKIKLFIKKSLNFLTNGYAGALFYKFKGEKV